MIKWIKDYFEDIKKRDERFNNLSSKDKLEYYSRFDHTPYKFLTWPLYVILYLISVVLTLTLYLNYKIGAIDFETITAFIFLIRTLLEISIYFIVFETIIGLITLAIFLYQKNKWLIDKGVIRK